MYGPYEQTPNEVVQGTVQGLQMQSTFLASIIVIRVIPEKVGDGLTTVLKFAHLSLNFPVHGAGIVNPDREGSQ